MATTAEMKPAKKPKTRRGDRPPAPRRERSIITPIGTLTMRFQDEPGGDGSDQIPEPRIESISIHISSIDCTDLLPGFFERAERCGVNFPEGFGTRLGEDIHGSMYLATGTRSQLDAFIEEIAAWRDTAIERKRTYGCRLYDLKTIARDEKGIMRRISSILAGHRIGILNLGFRTGIPPWENGTAIATIHLRMEVPIEIEQELATILDEIRESDRGQNWDIRCDRYQTWDPAAGAKQTDLIGITL